MKKLFLGKQANTDQKNYIDPADMVLHNQYLNDIRNIELLTPEEEVKLAQRIKEGDTIAEEKFIISNLRFVVSVARQYMSRNIPFADLISAGNIGLIKAARKFDETKGFKFTSYAVWWIRQSILSHIQESHYIRLPANKYLQIKTIKKISENLLQKNQCEPSIDEICEEISRSQIESKIDRESIIDILSSQNPLSLDITIDGTEDLNFYDIIPQSGFQDTDHKISSSGINIDIQTIISSIGYNPKNLNLFLLQQYFNFYQDNQIYYQDYKDQANNSKTKSFGQIGAMIDSDNYSYIKSFLDTFFDEIVPHLNLYNFKNPDSYPEYESNINNLLNLSKDLEFNNSNDLITQIDNNLKYFFDIIHNSKVFDKYKDLSKIRNISIFMAYYGLHPYRQSYDYEDVAIKFGIGRERARQISDKMLRFFQSPEAKNLLRKYL